MSEETISKFHTFIPCEVMFAPNSSKLTVDLMECVSCTSSKIDLSDISEILNNFLSSAT